MYKANGRLVDIMFSKKQADLHIDKMQKLKRKFKREGKFEIFKHTSSYVEIPPLNKTSDSGTYILRRYKGVELVSLGATLYFVESLSIHKYFSKKPKFLRLGESNLKVVKVDTCFNCLNAEGRKFQQQLLKDWEDLVQPVFSYKHF